MNKSTNRSMSRREFLRIGGLAMASLGTLLEACRPAGADLARTSEPAEAAAELPKATAASPRPTQPLDAPTAVPPQAAGVACLAGVVRDPFPGHCKRYVDGDGDGICDLSVIGSGDVTPRVRAS